MKWPFCAYIIILFGFRTEHCFSYFLLCLNMVRDEQGMKFIDEIRHTHDQRIKRNKQKHVLLYRKLKTVGVSSRLDLHFLPKMIRIVILCSLMRAHVYVKLAVHLLRMRISNFVCKFLSLFILNRAKSKLALLEHYKKYEKQSLVPKPERIIMYERNVHFIANSYVGTSGLSLQHGPKPSI